MRQMEKVKAVIRPLIKWDEAYRAALATQGIDSQGKFPPMDSLMHFFKQQNPLWLCLADFWQVIQEMVCRQVLAVEI